MSEILRSLARAANQGFKPAGYLPAPTPARFVSTAEEAAKRLPANIKAQSVMNQLQKFGAKPVELEYAGLGEFLEGKDRVSSQDVLQHLQQRGPLGQLKRVDQGDAPDRGYQPDLPLLQFDDEPPQFIDNENWAPPNNNLPAQQPRSAQQQPTGNFYQADVRAPFGSDPRGAYPTTRYARYTVPGQRGDYTGYREVLIEDPKEPKDPMVPGTGAGVVDAHDSHYWLRYNNLPDRVAIQNIQSDIGQRASRLNNDAMKGANRRLEELHDLRQRAGDDQGLVAEIDATINEIIDAHSSEFLAGPGPNGTIFVESKSKRLPASPIVRDNNWKNLMLRHALLESVNQGGKPITLPTGQQMVDVESFGQGGSGSAADPVAKATRFNEDLANRLMKAMKEIHPKGGTLERAPEPLGDHEFPELNQIMAYGLDGDFRRDVNYSLESEEPLGTLDNSRRPLRAMAQQFVDRPYNFIKGASGRLGPENQGRRMREWGGWSQAERDAVMKSVQQYLLMQEMGLDHGSLRADWQVSSDPGWTITPHPETVRAALQKGVPIMSLAPLLLSPQEEKK